MIRTFKYRLYPTRKQREALDRQLDIHCWLYNRALAMRKEAWESSGTKIGFREQCKYLTEFRDKCVDINACNRSSLNRTLRRLDKAFHSFFRRVKANEIPGYPRFKSPSRFSTIQYHRLGNGCQIKGDRLYLQNVGHVKVRWHRPIDGKVKTLSVTRKNGRWYVNFAVEREARALPAAGREIALDVGSRSFCVDSEGQSHPNPKYLKAAQDHLKRCQQRLARRKPGSRRREKARKLLSRAHEKVANQRRDFLHKLSHRYIRGYDTIYVEDLDILSMARSVKGDSRYIHKSITDAGWGAFFNFLSYKAEDAGRTVVKVDPAGTSETCSNCGALVPKSVRTRVHRCPTCGLKIGRDLNAAINIFKTGSEGAFGPGREVCGVTEKSA